MAILVVIVSWLGFASGTFSHSHRPEVNTVLGKIIGKTVYFNNIPVNTFQSIPYAKPPLGEYRFKKPNPIEPWEDSLLANHLPPGCIQYSSNLFPWLDDLPGKTLDCLYLNIWVPSTAGPSSKKAVMFWVHGGGFRIGSSRLDYYDGTALAALGDVVVVTINYRLGVEGFLYFGTDEAPGNMGLYDVLEALNWVKSNIECFGGNKNHVTFFGQSSGAITVGMLMVSPLARGLFARAILQSGSATNLDGEDNDRDYKLSQGVAKAVGCVPDENTLENDPNAVVSCLRDKDALELAKTVVKVSDNPQRGLYPRYGDEILPSNALKAIIDGKFENIDLLIGCNANEGATMVTKANTDVFGFFGEKNPQINKTYGEYLIGKYFKRFSIANAVVERYLGNLDEDDYDAVLCQVQTAYGDFARVCPSMFFAESVSLKDNRVFYYYFTHRSSNSPWANWMGVPHFEETPFVFGYPLKYPWNFTLLEQGLSARIIEYWTTFAKTGNLESWPQYSSSHYHHILDTDMRGTGIGPHQENCNFFQKYFGF